MLSCSSWEHGFAPGDLSYTGTVQKQNCCPGRKRRVRWEARRSCVILIGRLTFLFESPVSGMCPLSVGETQWLHLDGESVLMRFDKCLLYLFFFIPWKRVYVCVCVLAAYKVNQAASDVWICCVTNRCETEASHFGLKSCPHQAKTHPLVSFPSSLLLLIRSTNQPRQGRVGPRLWANRKACTTSWVCWGVVLTSSRASATANCRSLSRFQLDSTLWYSNTFS